MKILVPTKRVPDPDQRVRAAADGSGVDDSELYYVPNPFDLIAVEEALVIKEREEEEVEIVTVGIGSEDYEKELRTTLAMGADRALLVETNERMDPWSVALALEKVVEREEPDFVLMGKQAIDDDSNQAGQFLAARLGWSQATFIASLELSDAGALVERETDTGLESVQVDLPAVFTVDLRLNEPRYASMPQIMKARRLPFETVSLTELGVTVEPRIEVVGFEVPSADRTCRFVETADELLACLREEEEGEA
jgi:electron transfer flavoprotein beta subunit